MANYFPDHESRLRAQEGQSLLLNARLYELDRNKAEASAITEVKTEVQKLAESTDKRFEHVYGELADIKANTVEIRNLLASLVARLENKEK